MNEWLKPHVPQERRLMILGWPSQILHVATEGAGGDGAQPIRMIEKAEIFFNLNVTHIMPVADVWGRDFFEQPISTYSTGMTARLGFAVATTLAKRVPPPDVTTKLRIWPFLVPAATSST